MTGKTLRTLAIVGESSATLIEAAAERVATGLDDTSLHDHDAAAGIRHVAVLAVALSRVATGESVATVATGIPTTAFTSTVLDQIAHELIGASGDPRSTGAVMEALRAWSELRREMTRAPARTDDDSLRTQLDGPNAFELLVEVAHDFRSPLTSILFLAETLRDGHTGAVSEPQRSQLGLIYGAAFGLASVASDLVDLARRSQDLVGDDPEPYAFPEVFQSVERMIRPLVEEKGLELRIVVPEHGHQANGHPHALIRVLLNLATNALKFTDRGTVELGVRRLPHSRIEFYVQDTGRGIPDERQKDLFRPFKKRLGPSEDGHFFSGSGVGLTIAQRLVQAMGSTLEFQTSDETGTRFYFALQAERQR